MLVRRLPLHQEVELQPHRAYAWHAPQHAVLEARMKLLVRLSDMKVSMCGVLDAVN